MLKLTTIGMKISGKEYYGVTNPRFAFLSPIVNNMSEEELEREGRMSAYILQ